MKELSVPFIASGGIADARGIAAALALGAAVSDYIRIPNLSLTLTFRV